jgi:hypothetical protein
LGDLLRRGRRDTRIAEWLGIRPALAPPHMIGLRQVDEMPHKRSEAG